MKMCRLKSTLFIWICLLTFSNIAHAQKAVRTSVPGACGGSYSPSDKNALPQPQDGNGFLGQIFNQSACGLNYVQASAKVTTRYPTPAGTALPCTLNISGMPSCTLIDTAFLWMTCSYQSGSSPSPTISVTNPNNVTTNYTGVVIGSGGGKCWGEAGTRIFRTDVTSSVAGNGNYVVDVTGFSNKNWETDGITLMIIYRDPTASYYGTLVMNDGNMTGIGSTYSQTMNNIGAPCSNSTFAKGFIIVADMQSNINGGQHPATINGNSSNYTNNFYNFDMANITINSNQTTSSFGTSGLGSDCFTWSAMGIYYQTTTCFTCGGNGNMTISSATQDDICGNCNGQASVTVSGGVTPYTYQWDSNTGNQTTQTATGLCAGSYVITTTDAACAQSIDTVVISSSPPFTLTLSALDVLCQGDCNGEGTASVSGGASPFTYLWDNNTGNQTTANATGLCAGTYFITVADSNGCTSTDTVTISEPPQLNAAITDSSDLLCFNDNSGSATVTASGGTPGYSYIWSTGGTDSSATGLAAGMYAVTVTDNNGCSQLLTVVLSEPEALAMSDSSTDALCVTPSGSATVFVTGGSPPYTYLWEDNQTTQTAIDLSAGDHSVTVTDSNGCTEMHSVSVGVYNPLTALFEADPDQGLMPLYVEFSNLSSGGTAPYTWDWDFGNGHSSSEFEPTQTYDSYGTYTVTLHVRDDNGCKDEYALDIIVDVVSSIVIPNVFTPNQDGINDLFNILTSQISQFHCEIYNRWGEKIYEWDNHPEDAWDGGAHPDGTYYYILHATGLDGVVYDKTGYVTVIGSGN